MLERRTKMMGINMIPQSQVLPVQRNTIWLMPVTEDSARVGHPEDAGAPRGMYSTAGPEIQV